MSTMSPLFTTTIDNLTTGNTLHMCKDGIIVAAMTPSPWAALLYLAALLYCFLGIANGADVFMCAIERITSVTRKVPIERVEAENQRDLHSDDLSDVVLYKEVPIWNPTVANLTLMALGSSAPEILL
jgi:solute carrier family 8 (sodium/calcium exchanger)